MTPASVLAFGDRSVALWVDDGPDGRVIAIPIPRLLAVDDRRILLFGRLRFIAADGQLVVRYNTAEQIALRDNLGELRRRIAATRVPTERGFLWLDRRGEQHAPSGLPHKWGVVLRSPTVATDPDEPAIVAVGDVVAADPAPPQVSRC